MGRPKKEQRPEIPSDDKKLEQILRDLCNDEWQALALVNHLENTSYSRHANNEEDLSFCKSYTIALIQTYCKSTTYEEADNGEVRPKRIGNAGDKIEFVLAMYGLLEGFEFKEKSLGKRKRKYYEYAHGYNELVSGAWEGASIDTKTRDIMNDIAWELTNTLHDLKTKNDGKLGFLNNGSRELKLPHPRNSNNLSSLKAGGLLSLLKGLLASADREQTRVTMFFSVFFFTLFTALVAFVGKIAFSQARYPAPVSSDYPSGGNTTIVEKIRCTQPLITVYPGVTTSLPIEVAPDEAVGAYLLCNSTDETILTGVDGVVACVKASEYFEPGTHSAKVSVVVKPLYPESSDVFIEIPIEVDYTSAIPEPLN